MTRSGELGFGGNADCAGISGGMSFSLDSAIWVFSRSLAGPVPIPSCEGFLSQTSLGELHQIFRKGHST